MKLKLFNQSIHGAHIQVEERLHGEKTSLLLKLLLTMSLNRCILKNGPIFNNAYSVPSPYAFARFVSRCSAIRSRSRSLSYGSPRPAPIVFTPDVLPADAEIPYSTEDRCLCAACTPTLGYPGSSFLSLHRRSLSLLVPMCFTDNAAAR